MNSKSNVCVKWLGLLLYIQKALRSNLSPEARFSWFSQLFQATTRIVPEVRSWLLPSKCLPVCYSLIILSFNGTYFEILTVLLNKPDIKITKCVAKYIHALMLPLSESKLLIQIFCKWWTDTVNIACATKIFQLIIIVSYTLHIVTYLLPNASHNECTIVLVAVTNHTSSDTYRQTHFIGNFFIIRQLNEWHS